MLSIGQVDIAERVGRERRDRAEAGAGMDGSEGRRGGTRRNNGKR